MISTHSLSKQFIITIQLQIPNYIVVFILITNTKTKHAVSSHTHHDRSDENGQIRMNVCATTKQTKIYTQIVMKWLEA